MILLILFLTTACLYAADTIPYNYKQKGDIIIYNGKYPARQGVGNDGTVLSANSSKSNGVEWITITSGGGGTLTNIYNDSKGWVGISNTTPQATLDVAGNIRASAGISLASTNRDLTGNFTLMVGGDNMYQFFNCNGADRTIYLPSSATNGDMFFIKNITDSSLPYKLTIYDNKQSKTLDYLYSGKGKWYICNGTGWGSVDDYVVGETNMSSGYGAMAFTNGMAYGYRAQATNYGTAFGYQAGGNFKGVGIGYNANGSYYGAAMGNSANGSSYGAAVGVYANGANSGAAVGYSANGSSYGAAVGNSANGANYGAVIGIYANGANSGAAIGYAAGYRIVNGKTNILIGNSAGCNNDVNAITNGNYNLLVGDGAGLPNDCSYYLNIGNAIFGTNVQTKTGTNIDVRTKIGIATNEPNYMLEVNGDIGLGQNGNLYKGGEKLGWYSEGALSSSTIISIVFPVTNAIYKIEAGGHFQGYSAINPSSIGAYYGATDTLKSGTHREVMENHAEASGDIYVPAHFSTIVEISTETERVNYWKIKVLNDGEAQFFGNYILTRIR